MPHTIYALLVGINDYNNEHVNNLQGCLNDVYAITEMLETQYSFCDLKLKTLINQEATRANIIAGFREHLSQAGPEDVVLFHFSGHGSRGLTAKEFRQYISEDKEETLVCYDSRQAGHYDLADKELAVLLQEVAQKQAKITVVLDCCHAGSGTRSIDSYKLGAVRNTFERTDPRPLESYLDGWYLKHREATIPESRHVLLAACARYQEARESLNQSGLFTSTLINVLSQNPDISYADLYLACRRKMAEYAYTQQPQFETYQYFNAYTRFLDNKLLSKDRDTRQLHLNSGIWQVHYGALEGLSTDLHQTIEFAVYPSDSDFSEADIVAFAKSTVVRPDKCDVILDRALPDIQQAYQVRLLSIPSAEFQVFVDANPSRLVEFSNLKPDWLHVHLQSEQAGARYTIRIEDDQILLQHTDSKLFIQAAKGDFESAASYIFEQLQHIVRWERALALENPHSHFNDEDVIFKMYRTDSEGVTHEITDEEIIFEVVDSEDSPPEIRSKMKVHHSKDQPLYITLLYLSEEFGVYTLRHERIEQDSDHLTLWGGGENDYFYLLDDANEARFIFKLIVSTEPLDHFILEQDDLNIGDTRSFRGASRKGGLGNVKPLKNIPLTNDWTCQTFIVKLVRRQSAVKQEDVSLADGKIVVKGHPQLNARLSLTTAETHTRSPKDMAILPHLLKDYDMLNFSNRRGSHENVLEITDIQNDQVLKDRPLEIDINLPLADDELLFPMTFDGEDILPVGNVELSDNKQSLIIDHIPDNHTMLARGFKKALKLTFFKFVGSKNRLASLYQLTYLPDERVEKIQEELKEKVEQASKIMLLIHGLFGSTEDMATDLKAILYEQDYDLILGFDYETLNSKFEESALHLKEKLHAIGIHEKTGKQTDIIAQTSGGMMARYAIERLGCNKIVSRLVMLGPPNRGTVLAEALNLRTSLIALITLGISMGMPAAIIPTASAFLIILGRSKKVTVSMEQMAKSSDFIRSINTNNDPHVPYYIVAGNVETYSERYHRNIKRLIRKLQIQFSKLVFWGEPNDILVPINSIVNIDEYRDPKPQHFEEPCHHLNYSRQTESLKAVAKALKQPLPPVAEKI